MNDDERLVWLLGDLMNAVENIFCQENPKRLGHINESAIRIIDEIIQPLRDRAEKAERERDEWREHHDRADHRAFAYAQEIERLREALKRLSDAEYYDVTVTSIARAALEAKP